jgi:hypothetical protein
MSKYDILRDGVRGIEALKGLLEKEDRFLAIIDALPRLGRREGLGNEGLNGLQ